MSSNMIFCFYSIDMIGVSNSGFCSFSRLSISYFNASNFASLSTSSVFLFCFLSLSNLAINSLVFVI
jgi:hypothetical protein